MYFLIIEERCAKTLQIYCKKKYQIKEVFSYFCYKNVGIKFTVHVSEITFIRYAQY